MIRIVGRSRIEKNKERDVLHQLIGKVHPTREVGLPEERMGKVHGMSARMGGIAF